MSVVSFRQWIIFIYQWIGAHVLIKTPSFRNSIMNRSGKEQELNCQDKAADMSVVSEMYLSLHALIAELRRASMHFLSIYQHESWRLSVSDATGKWLIFREQNQDTRTITFWYNRENGCTLCVWLDENINFLLVLHAFLCQRWDSADFRWNDEIWCINYHLIKI